MALTMAAACLVVSIALAGGQILFKFAAQDIAGGEGGSAWAVLLSPWLTAALIVYALTTVLWVWILMHVPLTKAYPFVLLATALVPLAGHWIFSEPLTLKYLFGLILMMIGLSLIQTA